jgi:DNA-binding transcriptional MerR regulator
LVTYDALRWLRDTGCDIARIRKALGMQRSDLAVALGVGEIAVRKWEWHCDKPLAPSTVRRIQPQLDELRARVSAAAECVYS